MEPNMHQVGGVKPPDDDHLQQLYLPTKTDDGMMIPLEHYRHDNTRRITTAPFPNSVTTPMESLMTSKAPSAASTGAATYAGGASSKNNDDDTIKPPKRKRIKMTKVDHTYRDFSQTSLRDVSSQLAVYNKKASLEPGGGAADNNTNTTLQDALQTRDNREKLSFPRKLYEMVTNPEHQHIICFMPHGRSWTVLNKIKLAKEVLPKYFNHSKFESFNRQVNGWGFKRLLKRGPDHKSYYHECFLRGRPELTTLMVRLVTPGKRLPDKDNEPNFYDVENFKRLPELRGLGRMDLSSGVNSPVIDPSNIVTTAGPYAAQLQQQGQALDLCRGGSPLTFNSSSLGGTVGGGGPSRGSSIGSSAHQLPSTPDDTAAQMMFQQYQMMGFTPQASASMLSPMRVPSAVPSLPANFQQQAWPLQGQGMIPPFIRPAQGQGMTPPFINPAANSFNMGSDNNGLASLATTQQVPFLQSVQEQQGLSTVSSTLMTNTPMSSRTTCDGTAQQQVEQTNETKPAAAVAAAATSTPEPLFDDDILDQCDLSLYNVEPDPLMENVPLELVEGDASDDELLSNIEEPGPELQQFAELYFSST